MRTAVLAAILAVLTGVGDATAQTRASLSGTVTDTTGGALAGVTVQLTSGPAFAGRETITDAAGRYSFTGLELGRYLVTASTPQFATVTRSVSIDTASSVTVMIALPLALSADVVVTGSRTFRDPAGLTDPDLGLVGIARAASEGAVTAAELSRRPLQRSGDVLESVPGLIVSQHSGEGKANQFYLRGFNLDHGTDFATTIAGVPINLPTHAHGHGYSDVSLLIPELVSGVQFRKGPYFADTGDFSAAGAAAASYVNVLDRPFATLTIGGGDMQRLVAAASPRFARGHLLAGVELATSDGPWERPEDLRRRNALVRFTRGDNRNAFSITAQTFESRWSATDQLPQRAILSGALGRFATLDATDGGTTARHSVAMEAQRTSAARLTRVSAYAFQYRLDLFSNFTYALDNPDAGDQFSQVDRRWAGGGRVLHRRLTNWGARAVEFQVGGDVRHDAIGLVGLYRTAARVRLDTIREDAVTQSSAGVYGQQEIEWTPWLRSSAALRADAYRFHVTSRDPANSGAAAAALLSPKVALVFGPWRQTEIYVNAGAGFHSNDARGTTITRDPLVGSRAARVTPLVRATGAEAGLRTSLAPRTHMTATAWRLDLASELIFIGDAGTTEPGRGSSRTGIEWSIDSRLTSWLTADADIAWSHARFDGDDPAGSYIPGSLQTVLAGGLAVDAWRGWSGALRLRYFGARPLTEDGQVQSRPTALANGEIGYSFSRRWRVSLQAFNLLNRQASDIDYFYTSRLPGEPLEGVADVHSHPTMPRLFRISVRVEL
jgi:hypothetical protein